AHGRTAATRTVADGPIGPHPGTSFPFYDAITFGGEAGWRGCAEKRLGEGAPILRPGDARSRPGRERLGSANPVACSPGSVVGHPHPPECHTAGDFGTHQCEANIDIAKMTMDDT